MKKFLCGLLTATMIFTSSSVVNTKRVEAALEDHFDILTTLTGEAGKEEVEVTDRGKTIKVSVAESGVYNVTLASQSSAPAYALLSEKAKLIAEFSLFDGDEDETFHQVYFKKGKNYYFKNMSGTNNAYKCKLSVKKSNYEIEDEVTKHASITAFRQDCLEGNHSFNGNNINKEVKGVTWDEKTDTLTFDNYKGNYVFEISYWPIIIADSEDVKGIEDVEDYPVFTIKFIGENTFENMESGQDYTYPIFKVANIDVNFVGDGTVNVKKYNHVNPTTAEKTEKNYSFIQSNSTVTFDGPTVNVDKVFDGAGTFIASILKVKSGEINVKSYSAAKLSTSSIYRPIFLANNLSLEGGSIFIKVEEQKAEELSAYGLIFEGDYFLNVTDDMIIGVDVDESLLIEVDNKALLYLYGCEGKNNSEDCTISEKAKVFAEKGANKEKVLTYINGEKQDNTNKGNTSVTKNVKSNNGPKVGTKISDKKFTYKVTKAGTKDGKKIGEVTVTGLKNKKAKKATIKGTVKINGVKYKVTSISKKAFKKCKKLKKITIKSKTINKIAKGAFKGVSKKCIIKTPKAKKKAYKKLLKKAGFKGKVK